MRLAAADVSAGLKMEIELLFLIIMTFVIFEKSQCELSIRPFGSNFIKSLHGSIVFTCEFVRNGGSDSDEDVLPVWKDKNDEIIESETRRYVDNDLGIMKLYIISIQENDVGEYKCVRGTESKSVHLHIYKDISFDDAPKVQYFNASGDALVKCLVSGVPSPRVSWRVDGRRVSPSGSEYVVESDGLRIMNVTEGNAGIYTCMADVDVDGRYEDRRISVIIKHAPRIVEELGEVVAVEGQGGVKVQCKMRGIPEPTIEFFKVLPDNSTTSSLPAYATVANGSLIFNEVNRSDEGRYRCIATNELGSQGQVGFLKVLVPPSIVLPDNVTAILGLKVTVSCLGLGDPAPFVSFVRRMDGRNLSVEDDEQPDKNKFTADNSIGFSNVTITNLDVDDSGIYTCHAESYLGRSSKDVELSVQYGPQFESDMTPLLYGRMGQKVNLTCKVQGEPKVKVQWFKGHELISTDNELIRIFESDEGSTLQASLNDQGMFDAFICRGINELGSNDFTFTLREANVPDRPDVRVTRLRTDDIVIDVINNKTQCDQFTAILSYSLQLVDDGDDRNTVNLSVPVRDDSQEGLNLTTTTTATIARLLPNTTYILLVRAVNRIGSGEEATVGFTTRASGVPDAVDINATSSESTSVTLTWQPPYSGGSNIVGYVVSHRKVQSSNGSSYKPLSTWHDHSFPCRTDLPPTMVSTVNVAQHSNLTSYHHVLPQDQLTFEISDLQPSTLYQVKVVAFNSIGRSEPHPDYFTKTAKGNSGFLPYFLKTPNSSIIIIIISVVIVTLVVITDVTCYVINGCGITMCCCVLACGRSKKQTSPRMNKAVGRKDGSDVNASSKEPPVEADGRMSSDETLDVVVIDNDVAMATGMLTPEVSKQEKTDVGDDDDDDDDGKMEEKHPLMGDVDDREGGGDDDDELTFPPPPPPLASSAPIMHADKTELITPKKRRSMMTNFGDVRWKDVVHELETQLGVKKSEPETSEAGEGDQYSGPSSPKWRHT